MLIGDDGGVSPEIDAALIELLSKGVLKSADAIVNGRASTELVRELSLHDPILGLHLNLSTGAPVHTEPASNLAPGGRFLTPSAWVGPHSGVDEALAALVERASTWPRSEIVAEIAQQIARFEAVACRPPARISVHHDLDQVDVVAEAVAQCTDVQTRRMQVDSGSIASYGYGFAPDQSTPEDWRDGILRRIERARVSSGRHLIACHPAKSAHGYEDFSAYSNGRVIEYQGLLLLGQGRTNGVEIV